MILEINDVRLLGASALARVALGVDKASPQIVVDLRRAEPGPMRVAAALNSVMVSKHRRNSDVRDMARLKFQ